MSKKRLKNLLEDVGDVAPWYRGTSISQDASISNLPNDLRDDFAQGTSYRCKSCLDHLGVVPLINEKKIFSMVQLSRGNALAFLYFVLEGYYRTYKADRNYTTNEQLLMTAIAKTDLLPTVRELDRILPPGPPPKLKQKGNHKAPSEKQSAQQATEKPKVAKVSKKSPYFQKLRRPKQRISKMTALKEKFEVGFPFWPIGEPPNYGPETPAPWFMEYDLNPGSRSVKNVLKQALNDILNENSITRTVQIIARNSVEASLETVQKLEQQAKYCKCHKRMQAETQLLQDELTVITRDRCLEMADVPIRERKRRHKRIAAQLEHDIDLAMEKYSNVMKMGHTPLQVITEPCCTVCQKIVSTPVPNETIKSLVGECTEMAHTNGLESYKGKRLTGGGLRLDAIEFKDDFEKCHKTIKLEAEDCKTADKALQRCSSYKQTTPKNLGANFQAQNLDTNVYMPGKITKKVFFKAPAAHKPYQFQYKRIFNTASKDIYDEEKYIKKCFVNALKKNSEEDLCKVKADAPKSATKLEDLLLNLGDNRETNSTDSNEDTSSHSQHSHIDTRAEIIDAVVLCAKEMWKRKVAVKRAQTESVSTTSAVSKTFRDSEPAVITYDTDTFDPNDDALMDRLLADGMKELTKNTRYVLATLPNAHKMPVLREWVKRRYGKVYSAAEIRANLESSQDLFNSLGQMISSPPNVDLMGMSESTDNFSNYDKTKKLGKKITRAYYSALNEAFMQQVSTAWIAMGGYLMPSGPPKKTFYAYFPATHRNILRYKTWTGEFRNHRQFRQNAASRKLAESNQL